MKSGDCGAVFATVPSAGEWTWSLAWIQYSCQVWFIFDYTFKCCYNKQFGQIFRQRSDYLNFLYDLTIGIFVTLSTISQISTSAWQSASILANVSSTNFEHTNTASSVYYVLPILYIQHRFTMDIWCLDCIRACNHILGGIFSAAHKKYNITDEASPEQFKI